MRKSEIKEQIQNIFEHLKDVEDIFNDKKEDIEEFYDNLANTNDSLVSLVSGIDTFDEDNIKQDFFRVFVEENTEFTNIKEEIQDLYSNIEDAIIDMSESKQEEYGEILNSLDQAIDLLELEEIYEVEDMLDRLTEIKNFIKDLL